MKKQEQNKEALKSLKKIEERYKALFASQLGKEVLEDMKASLGYGKTVYAEKSTNQDLSFHLGRQSVINDLVNLLNKP